MTYFKTWKEVMFNPIEFYEKLPKKLGYRAPTIFALKTQALVMGILILLIIIFGSLFMGLLAALNKTGEGFSFGGEVIVMGILFMALIFIVSILLTWAFLYIGSAILHLFVTLFKGQGTFKETFKIVGYSIAPALFAFIPIVNYFVGIYSMVLQGIGIHKQHKLSVGKSVAVVLLPTIIIIVPIIFIYMFFIFSMIVP